MKPIIPIDELGRLAAGALGGFVTGQGLYSFRDSHHVDRNNWNFFQIAVGKEGVTYADTNMQKAGQLHYWFVITGIRMICIDFGAHGLELKRYHKGSYELYVGCAAHQRGPIEEIYLDGPKVCDIDPPIAIAPFQNFTVKVKFESCPTPRRVGVFLDGLTYFINEDSK